MFVKIKIQSREVTLQCTQEELDKYKKQVKMDLARQGLTAENIAASLTFEILQV